MELINIKNASYSYDQSNLALKNVNLTINSGEKVAILGENGAGKSTLFQLFNGLIVPDKGKVIVDGLEINKKNLLKIRSKVGMIFQDSDDQLFNSTVHQEIAYGLMNMGIKGQELEASIKWALKAVGIEGYEKRSPFNLSGGEKKRVALASVLAMKPKVLVLDEPTAALDPRGVSQIVKLLNYINSKLHITLIFATHDVDIVPLLADRIYLLNKGEIVLSGTTKEVFSNKKVIRDIGLRLPRIAHLAEILEKDGVIKLDNGELPLTIGQIRRVLENQKNRK
ncbi:MULTISPECIES: energy-coupling factor ABC transporter ATP-binding protein [Clostridium]|uniref:energy-coupling factor ABC transporter ATP-binding protein n=1 Tax=Clostridium TaxID=1485 RepID=UPI000824C803|nr:MULTISPECIES: ATP-binding cassette domain-containing protein [Clostridium]PJI10032.1 energy-coupling factor ABC transporter ATP-binding protein [Clostridium sp. CT7]